MKHDFALQTAWARHSFGESWVKHQLAGEARAKGLLVKDMQTNTGKSHLTQDDRAERLSKNKSDQAV
jgi:hypothetical protein